METREEIIQQKENNCIPEDVHCSIIYSKKNQKQPKSLIGGTNYVTLCKSG